MGQSHTGLYYASSTSHSRWNDILTQSFQALAFTITRPGVGATLTCVADPFPALRGKKKSASVDIEERESPGHIL
ncbi:hypothetical protein OUZ56_019232 [Daphnia magna]|uniref:Uncharacterized protein n=1 Tax=Daphnia magna TaxID=35525 RepID=A0ABQ9ZB11_9CRUS|nr:hypothetical protein OUZ56_019232 [Daphnia magna]